MGVSLKDLETDRFYEKMHRNFWIMLKENLESSRFSQNLPHFDSLPRQKKIWKEIQNIIFKIQKKKPFNLI